MKILKYKLVLNSSGNLSVPDYITDGGYFSSNGNNDEWLIGVSNALEVPEGTIEMSIQNLKDYVISLNKNKINMETMESVIMTEQEKIDEVNNWINERGF
jgi:hypothetical protein